MEQVHTGLREGQACREGFRGDEMTAAAGMRTAARIRERAERSLKGGATVPGGAGTPITSPASETAGLVVPPASGAADIAAALQFMEQMWLQARPVKYFKRIIS